MNATAEPFTTTADPAAYVPRAATEALLDELERRVRESTRPVAVSGPSGLGKTMVLRVLEGRLANDFQCLHVPYPALVARELCAFILDTLGQPPAIDPEGALLDFAFRGAADGRSLVLLIDDASAMPTATARSLSRLAEASGGALRLVLAAVDDSRVGAALAALGPDLDELRLVDPMNEEETAAYVSARLEGVGQPSESRRRLEDGSALAQVFVATGGVPRRVSELGSFVLRAPEGAATSAIVAKWLREEGDEDLIGEAFEDVSETAVPAPSEAAEAAATAGSAVAAGSPGPADESVDSAEGAERLATADPAHPVDDAGRAREEVAAEPGPASPRPEVAEPVRAAEPEAPQTDVVEPEPAASDDAPIPHDESLDDDLPELPAGLAAASAAEDEADATGPSQGVAANRTLASGADAVVDRETEDAYGVGAGAAVDEPLPDEPERPSRVADTGDESLRDAFRDRPPPAVWPPPPTEAAPERSWRGAGIAAAVLLGVGAAGAFFYVDLARPPSDPLVARQRASDEGPAGAVAPTDEDARDAAPSDPPAPEPRADVAEAEPPEPDEASARSQTAEPEPVPARRPGEAAEAPRPPTSPPSPTSATRVAEPRPDPRSAGAARPRAEAQAARAVSPPAIPAPDPIPERRIDPIPELAERPVPTPRTPPPRSTSSPPEDRGSREVASAARPGSERSAPAPRATPPSEPAPRPAAALAPISVNVNAVPWAVISVDGEEVGETPLAGLELAPGPHEFRAELPGGRVVERTVEIGPENRFLSFR